MAHNRLTAGLAWATPVRPDELGQRLEHYAGVLPTLKGLRLCHRFGQGQDAHVTRLPVEVELAIEAIIIQDKQSPSQHGREKWADKFRHYEGRCSPTDHEGFSFSDDLSDWTPCGKCDGIPDVELCELRCQPGALSPCHTCSQKLDPGNCMKSCDALQFADRDSYAEDFGSSGSCPYQAQMYESWEEAIDQTGAFARYDTILEEQFGLKAFFAPSRISIEDVDIWPRHRNHQFHEMDQLRTTICYLTVSQTLAPKKTAITSTVEHAGGYPCDLSSVQVIKLGQPSFALTNTVKKRFQRALDILNLKAYVHPSQGTSLVMPTLSGPNQGESPSVPPGQSTTGLHCVILAID
ncbi:uncharacterized protein SEPMUDRAFT_57899 [Sphaerulina musiva SO2202]|uniref:Uncharacterized protein n=1 Tax=Sphaerulina musiva (strain SO2202) TaxID=692275 RepID=N1QN08_SPHMS|nr:uncharacterized protein SEPMUDRAFT_57899 [Sphaerulina musiva SO2202]EMF17458.1 hypothetical protein SEPMUDRAFT_57899 [Sphaerulina musiva SO2202]